MSTDRTGTVNCMFEWMVPRFRSILHYGNCMYSPDFHQPDSSWYMSAAIINNIYFESKYVRYINIHLHRGDSGKPKTITFTMKFNGKTNVIRNEKTHHFERRGSVTEGLIILEKDWISDLLITCYIENNTPHPVEESKFVSCAVQTEAINKTEVFENENPKCKDWPSTDIKGVALLSERMKDLLMKGTDHDVTICVRDKKFRAHRSILSIRSPVFAMMFSHDTKENNTSTIDIEDCDPDTFDAFLMHVYSGRAENLTPSNALQLYYTADKYDFPVLKELCVNLLETSLSVESIYDAVLLAAKFQEKELLDVAAEFFARNVKKILKTVGWQNFMTQNPVEANELYIKSMEILHPEN